jgi:protein kinase N
VYATLRVDHKLVARSDVRPLGSQAWDQRFTIELDKSRELEIDVYWNDRRSMCAFTSLKLGDFIDVGDVAGGGAATVLPLEPYGVLFVEFKYLNPVVSRKPKLQRQKRLFNQKRECEHTFCTNSALVCRGRHG